MTIIKKFEPIKENKKRYSKKYIGVTVFCLMFLIVLEIWVQNSMVLYGEKFDKLSNLERVVKMENQILQNEIAKQASLQKMASKSAELGFIRVENVQYIR